MDNGRHDRSLRCGIAPQLVGDESPGLASLSLAFQQFAEEAFGGTPIATRLDKNVDHVAVPVDSTPEIMLPTPDGHEELIQVPRITQATLSPFEPTSIRGAELMRRVFEVDVLKCPQCGGAMRILAAIHPPEATRAILECVGLASRPPPARPPAPDTTVDLKAWV